LIVEVIFILRLAVVIFIGFVLRLFLNYVFRPRLRKQLKLLKCITKRCISGEEVEFLDSASSANSPKQPSYIEYEKHKYHEYN
jgi:hypothetical protein